MSANRITFDLHEPRKRLATCQECGTEYTSTSYGHGKKIMGWTGCPPCKVAQDKAEAVSKAKAERQQKAAELERELESMGVPRRFRKRNFDNYETNTPAQRRNKAICQRYAERFPYILDNGIGLLMYGRTGNGKNHLAMAIANQIVPQGYTVKFAHVSMMLANIKAADDESERIREWVKPDLLILDEIGDQVGSKSDYRLLNVLLSERYNDDRPTILLSNLPVEAEGDAPSLVKYLGDKQIERFEEGGGAKLFFPDESYRKKAYTGDLWQGI